MSYDEALLTLIQYMLMDDMENTLSTCEDFPEISDEAIDTFRSTIFEILGDSNIFKNEDLTQIYTALKLEKTEPVLASLDLLRNPRNYNTTKAIKDSKAYKLLENSQTEYFNDIERSGMVRLLSTRAIGCRDLGLIQFLLSKVQEYGI